MQFKMTSTFAVLLVVFVVGYANSQQQNFVVSRDDLNPGLYDVDEVCDPSGSMNWIKVVHLMATKRVDESLKDDRETLCWVACMLENLDFMGKDGNHELKYSNMLERVKDMNSVFSVKYFELMVGECSKKADKVKDPCKKAYVFTKCGFDLHHKREMAKIKSQLVNNFYK